MQNTNDLIYAVATRAKKLCSMSMDELRLLCTNDPKPTISSVREEYRGFTKGELVEIALTDELIEDIPSVIEYREEE